MGVKCGGGAGFVAGVWLNAGTVKSRASEAMRRRDGVGNGLLLGTFYGTRIKDGRRIAELLGFDNLCNLPTSLCLS